MRTITARWSTAWKLVALCALALGTLYASKLCIPLRFIREEIRIQARKGSIEVSGLYEYLYAGKKPREILLFAPFPVDEGMKFADSIIIEEAGESGPFVRVPTKRLFNRVYFPIDCFPGRSTIVRLRYTQRVEGNTFTYILTTTKSWRQPIEDAHFEISGIPGSQLVINYPFDKDHDIYRATFRNFFPQVDLKITQIGDI